MLKKKQNKKERRAAFEREQARRNRQIESSLPHSAAWNNSQLSTLINTHAPRIGALLVDPELADQVTLVLKGIKWPTETTYRSSKILYRAYLQEQNMVEAESMPDETVEDHMPLRVSGFKFLEANQDGFWPDWEKDFEGVDTDAQYPFGSDDHYYYFVSDNPVDSSEPMVYKVDHEEVYETPYCPGNGTLGQLLLCLERDLI